MAKRTHDRLEMTLSAGRAIPRGFHIEWCACRRSPAVVTAPMGRSMPIAELVADRFDSLVETMRYLLLCLYVHARLARQADGSWG